jgi:K+/H+ antiporter YhaU regulatory subunit KhtT
MTASIASHIAKEIKITAQALRESIIAVAERVNRKIQVLILHWRVGTLHEHIDRTYQTLGSHLCLLLSQQLRETDMQSPVVGSETDMIFCESVTRVRTAKQELREIDMVICELETETLREDLAMLQHDLSVRSAMIRRVVVERDAMAVGRSMVQLGLPSTVRVAAVLRGPALIPGPDQAELRRGDIIVLVGPRTDLQRSLSSFG